MELKNKLVSIVTPVYNAESTIEETIISVKEQEYKYIEHIIVDDNSNDLTLSIINKFSDIIVLKNTKKGACSARNYGASKAKGEYILFLDADDLLDKNTISCLIENQPKNNNKIVFCFFRRLKKKNDTWFSVDSGLSQTIPKNDLIYAWLTGWYVPPGCILWPVDIYKSTDGWDNSLAANQDGDLVLRALISGHGFVYINKELFHYRHFGTEKKSISSTKTIVSYKSRFKVLLKVIKNLKQKKLFEKYKIVIAKGLHKIARNAILIDSNFAIESEKKAIAIAGFKRLNGSFSHVLLCFFLGLKNKENIIAFLSKIGLKKNKRKKTEDLLK